MYLLYQKSTRAFNIYITMKKIYEDMKKERIIWLEKAIKALESERYIAKSGSVRN